MIKKYLKKDIFPEERQQIINDTTFNVKNEISKNNKFVRQYIKSTI